MSIKQALYVSAALISLQAFSSAEAVPVHAAAVTDFGLTTAADGRDTSAYRMDPGASRRDQPYRGRSEDPDRDWKLHWGF